jgi:hypothetical protein
VRRLVRIRVWVWVLVWVTKRGELGRGLHELRVWGESRSKLRFLGKPHQGRRALWGEGGHWR